MTKPTPTKIEPRQQKQQILMRLLLAKLSVRDRQNFFSRLPGMEHDGPPEPYRLAVPQQTRFQEIPNLKTYRTATLTNAKPRTPDDIIQYNTVWLNHRHIKQRPVT